MSEEVDARISSAAVDAAVGLEEHGRLLYLRLAELMSDPISQQMFGKLAEDERQHGEILRQGRSELVPTLDPARLDWVVDGSARSPSPVSSLLSGASEAMIAAGHSRCCSELDAIAIAVVLELASIRSYADLLRVCQSDAARLTLRRLLEEEEKHFEILGRRAQQVFRDLSLA
ncbi:MAG: ferritin family protein [candidate division KSB1 bacterium]|nr:ferritin family protein [candidate division KSB1 bacterium]